MTVLGNMYILFISCYGYPIGDFIESLLHVKWAMPISLGTLYIYIYITEVCLCNFLIFNFSVVTYTL